MHKIIAIEANRLKLGQVRAFIDTITDVVKGRGPGAGNRFGGTLGVEPIDALRVFAGVSETWLTETRQRLFEVVYGYTIDGKTSLRPEIWTNNPCWLVSNPNASTGPLDESALDTDFIQNFGLTKAAFERDVLHSGGIVERTKKGTDSDGDRLRAYIALAMFGFADPGQFFRSR